MHKKILSVLSLMTMMTGFSALADQTPPAQHNPRRIRIQYLIATPKAVSGHEINLYGWVTKTVLFLHPRQSEQSILNTDNNGIAEFNYSADQNWSGGSICAKLDGPYYCVTMTNSDDEYTVDSENDPMHMVSYKDADDKPMNGNAAPYACKFTHEKIHFEGSSETHDWRIECVNKGGN